MRIKDDNGLSALLRSHAETKLCGGFGFTEGPIWVPNPGCLLFSDIAGNRIHRWEPGLTAAEIYREPSRNSNGLTLDHDGNVLACEHFGRQVSIGAYGGAERTLVDRFEGKRLNSPNDVVVHSSGAVYFTDPPFGLGPNDVRELPFPGVYRSDPDGTLTRVEVNLAGPNGLVFSPDESILYVGDSSGKFINRYRVNEDGSLGAAELFVDQRNDDGPGVPDGMKVDDQGRLWTTGVGGVSVFSTLYLTAQTSVYAIETAVRGIAPRSRG